MSIFEFDHYKLFIHSWIKNRPKAGHGELRRIANLLRIHSTMISHIIRGNSHFTLEQVVSLASYLGLNDLETDYFMELVQLERAGSESLKKRIKKRIEAIRISSGQIKSRMPNEQKSLLSHEKAVFYSSWHFSAIRLMATLGKHDLATIGKSLGLSNKRIREAADFLCKAGLCEMNSSGLTAKRSMTHLGSDSPHVWKHHQSWRIKAMERYFDLCDEELMYSGPLTISLKDMGQFRKKLLSLIQELGQMVSNTDPEAVACLNLDWIRVA